MNEMNSTVTQKQRLALYFVVQLIYSVAFCCCLLYPNNYWYFVLTSFDNSSVSILPIIFILFMAGSWKWYNINSKFFRLKHVIFNLVIIVAVSFILFVFSHVFLSIVYLFFCFFIVTKDLDEISERTYKDSALCQSHPIDVYNDEDDDYDEYDDYDDFEDYGECYDPYGEYSDDEAPDCSEEEKNNCDEHENPDCDADEKPICENIDKESSDIPEGK